MRRGIARLVRRGAFRVAAACPSRVPLPSASGRSAACHVAAPDAEPPTPLGPGLHHRTRRTPWWRSSCCWPTSRQLPRSPPPFLAGGDWVGVGRTGENPQGGAAVSAVVFLWKQTDRGCLAGQGVLAGMEPALCRAGPAATLHPTPPPLGPTPLLQGRAAVPPAALGQPARKHHQAADAVRRGHRPVLGR